MRGSTEEESQERDERGKRDERGSQRTKGSESSCEMSHRRNRLVPRPVLEDGDVNVGWTQEGSDSEEGLEEMRDDSFGVEEVESEVEALRFRDVRRGLISFFEREKMGVARLEEGGLVALTREDALTGDGGFLREEGRRKEEEVSSSSRSRLSCFLA